MVVGGGLLEISSFLFVNWYAFEQMRKKSVYPLAWFCNAEGFSFAICKHPLKIITLRSSFNPHKMQRIGWFGSFGLGMTASRLRLRSLGAAAASHGWAPQLSSALRTGVHLFKSIFCTHFCGAAAQDPRRQPVKYVATERRQTAELTMQPNGEREGTMDSSRKIRVEWRVLDYHSRPCDLGRL